MLFSFSTFCTIVLLLSLAVTICLRHASYERKYLLPAILLLIGYILVDQALFSYPIYSDKLIPIRLYIQVLLAPACLLFSLTFARVSSIKSFKRTDIYLFVFSLLTFGIMLFLPNSAYFYQTDFQAEPVIFLEQASFYVYLYISLMYIISIGNLESTLRNSIHSEQWRIKIALLGIGIVFVFLMIYASQGLLYKMIDIRNISMRNIGICLGTVFILYSEWKRKSNEVLISRKIVFRSVVAVISGLYFIGLGIAREGNRVFGGSFTQSVIMILTITLFCGGIAILLSQSLRRTVMIWIQRNFYNEKYDYRLQWMQFSEHLSRAVDYNSFIDATLISFCDTFGRLGAIYIPVDTEYPNSMGQSFYYEVDKNSELDFTDKDFLHLLHSDPKPLFVTPNDLKNFSAQSLMLLLKMQIGIVLPIHASDSPEGLLLLGHPINGKEKYDNEDFELMEAMGRQIGLSAKSFRVSEEKALNREIKAFDKLGTFVLHDIKNQVYTLSLLSNNARNFIADPEFQKDMLETLSNTVGKMKILISQLAHLPNAGDLQLEKVYLKDLAQKVASQIPNARINISGENPAIIADSDQIAKVFLNLYLNAIEAKEDSDIKVTIDFEDKSPVFHVEDMAGGLAPEVVEAGVFKAFNTTKPRGMGIGLYHSRKILEAHGAKISVNNRPNEGCTFTIRFEDK